MRKITDEEVLETEVRITVEQYLGIIDRIADTVLVYIDMYEKSKELKEAKKRFQDLFQVLREGHFEGFKDAIIRRSENHDAEIN